MAISSSEFIQNPNWENFGNVALDLASFALPYLPGSYAYKSLGKLDELGDLALDSAKALKRADKYTPKGVWTKGIAERGYELERRLGGMCNNFRTIDKFVEASRVGHMVDLSDVTSIKSIDLSAPTYLDPSKLEKTLKKYVDDLFKFSGTVYKGDKFTVLPDASKSLEVAIPPVAPTTGQQKAIDTVMEYAKSLGIDISFIRME